MQGRGTGQAGPAGHAGRAGALVVTTVTIDLRSCPIHCLSFPPYLLSNPAFSTTLANEIKTIITIVTPTATDVDSAHCRNRPVQAAKSPRRAPCCGPHSGRHG